jgi:hypothetical protein
MQHHLKKYPGIGLYTQQSIGQDKVTGTANRQELGETLDQPHDKRL